MVNGFFPEPSRPVIFAGRTLQKANPADAAAALILYNILISWSFPVWHGRCNTPARATAWESAARSTEWPPGRVVRRRQGSSSDGEYPSHWAVAADRAATRARRRRQQHRQYEHYRLQGRRRGVRRISAQPRQRRAVCLAGPAHEHGAGSHELARHEPGYGPAERRPT